MNRNIRQGFGWTIGRAIAKATLGALKIGALITIVLVIATYCEAQ